MSDGAFREEDEKVCDITIVGGGPTATFAALHGGVRTASVKILQSMPQLGGHPAALTPDKCIHDVADFPKVRAQELVHNLIEQAKHFDPTICLSERVLNVERHGDHFTITTQKGRHFSKTILIPAGVGAFEPRKLKLSGVEKYEKTNLHYFVSDLQSFQGQRVMVAGGG